MEKSSIITVRKALEWGRKNQQKSRKEPLSPEEILEMESLIAHKLGKERASLRIYPDEPISPQLWDEIQQDLDKLKKGIPLAYLIGKVEFMSLPFFVDSRVLIPRPETETLVESVLENLKPAYSLLDLGTGSGCIGLSIAHYLQGERILLTDISQEALEVAKKNALSLGLANQVEFRISNLFSSISKDERMDVITMNPPYIGEDEKSILPSSLFYEPWNALFAPEEGLYFYRKLAKEAPEYLEAGGFLALELTATRPLNRILSFFENGRFSKIEIKKDLAGKNRVLLAWKG